MTLRHSSKVFHHPTLKILHFKGNISQKDRTKKLQAKKVIALNKQATFWNADDQPAQAIYYS